MSIEQLYQIFLQFPDIFTDSRNIKPNGLYFALKGERFDGNKYALESIQKGAKFAIVDDVSLAGEQGCILVPNVLKLLQDLATYHRRELNIPIIGITGTNGKTTTKELLNAVLKQKFVVYATVGNLNNHIGVPLTLLSMTKKTEIGIVEMGANHCGEIDFLCKIAEPNFGMITNIGKAHLEGFGSFEGVIQTKTELYRYLNDNQGVVFYNSDNVLLETNIKGLTCKLVAYGTSKNECCFGEIITPNPNLFANITCVNSGSELNLRVESQLVGAYNLENIVASVCIGNYFGVPNELIAEAIRLYCPTNNRSQLVKKGSNQLLLDYYNANPSSMDVAIRNFHDATSNLDKILILGEMLELGEYSQLEHEKLVENLILLGFEKVMLVGKSFKGMNKEGIDYFNDVLELSIYLQKAKVNNSFILLKGSRGVKLENCLEYLDY
jgi:UDP-N-acetylmuramoyl-tripeptide--D-alanyl-D-alanine ligase